MTGAGQAAGSAAAREERGAREERPEVAEGLAGAQALRRELGLAPEEPLACAVRVAEESLGLAVVLAPLPDGCSGFYLPAVPAPIVVVSATHPVQRQRFTLAHEIAHHRLGHHAAARIHGASGGGAGDGAPVPASHYAIQPSPSAIERAANTFAGELLAPTDGARAVCSTFVDDDPLDRAVRLSAHYGLSALAAAVKLQMLGQLDQPQIDALRARLAAGEHLARYDALQLTPVDDELQRHAGAGGGVRCNPATRAALRRLRLEADALA